MQASSLIISNWILGTERVPRDARRVKEGFKVKYDFYSSSVFEAKLYRYFISK